MYLRGLILAALLPLTAAATELRFVDAGGEPLANVMVTRTLQDTPPLVLGADGYPADGVSNRAATATTRFTDADGRVHFADTGREYNWRARAQGYRDLHFDGDDSSADSGDGASKGHRELALQAMTAREAAAHYPSNVWLSQLDLGGDAELRKSFLLNCAFCHQQASVFMRGERSEQEWLAIMQRMNRYGARLPEDDRHRLAARLPQAYRELREQPQRIPAPRPWEDYLAGITMTEWPIGDGFSQMHDFLLHPNGMVYVGDNLFDRIYEVDPASGKYTVYQIPREEGDRVGGILGNRFTAYPKMQNYLGVHSFALSPSDGNIFLTPSMQQALLEFDVDSKQFTVHRMDEGYYPHTIRADASDRIWFTLALSSQVAMFDRDSGEFTLYDLPARSFKEWLIFKSLPLLFSIDPEKRPQPAPDRAGTGVPMPYGIDVAPDGGIWVARLYADDLAHIDPDSGEVTMIDFPYAGPRRLRADADGNLWIVAFQDSLLVKYDPRSGEFSDYALPVRSEVPYALNVDRRRGIVWVNGNQSDTLLSFDIASESWRVYPLPRRRFFSRDVEIDEDSGAVYTTNSHFPTYQSEGATPTLLRIAPTAP